MAEQATAIRTISKEKLLDKMNKGEDVQIVNVLAPEYYDLGAIRGSKKIPLDQLDQRINELDKNKEVVTYCASVSCHASRNAAEKLAAQGFNVAAYEGGIHEWKQAGLPTQG